MNYKKMNESYPKPFLDLAKDILLGEELGLVMQ